MDFLNDFKKEVSKIDTVTFEQEPPRYWFSSGNFCVNHVLSGSFLKAVPQGRSVIFAGPSGSGKSYQLCNVIREAQRDGAFAFVLDSEDALDDDFVQKAGVDTSEDNYMYLSVAKISDVEAAVSKFTKMYKTKYGQAEDAPKIIIGMDSLDMLLTDTEEDNYEKGKSKGDQGQKNKQLKHMLRTLTQDIKHHNITFVATSQVYQNQDATNGEGKWIVSDAVRYAPSIIALFTQLKLKDEQEAGKFAGKFAGIRMRCKGFKTRFTKPFQQIEINVPYDTGVDPYSGLVDAAIGQGVVQQKGAWYNLADDPSVKWQSKNFTQEIGDKILHKLEGFDELLFDVDVSEEETNQNGEKSAKQRREDKAKSDKKLGED